MHAKLYKRTFLYKCVIKKKKKVLKVLEICGILSQFKKLCKTK